MAEIKSLVNRYSRELEEYFIHTDTLIIVILDSELNITAHNDCFKKILSYRKDFSGKKILSFLLPESHGLLPLPDGTNNQQICLNFKAPDSSPIPLNCHIFKIDNEKHLILGGHLMLTNEKILQEMTQMSNEMANITRDIHRKNRALEEAHSKIKILSGIIPICMHCKEIRDDKGYWNRLEKFISEHSEAQFSHSICDNCMDKLYPE